uniref:Uncharacterized protein n=1 Tax=viral metagenome TaxID=1070528 RepID=A0A6M3JSF6_9ZZZZ
MALSVQVKVDPRGEWKELGLWFGPDQDARAAATIAGEIGWLFDADPKARVIERLGCLLVAWSGSDSAVQFRVLEV